MLSLPIDSSGLWLSVSDNHLWKQKSNLESILIPHRQGESLEADILPTRWAAAGRPREAGALPAGARWRSAGRGPDWRMAFGIPWKPNGRNEGKSSKQNRLASQDSQLQEAGWGSVHQGEHAHCSCWKAQPKRPYSQKCSLTLRSSSLLPAWVGSHLCHLIGCIISGPALSLKKD